MDLGLIVWTCLNMFEQSDIQFLGCLQKLSTHLFRSQRKLDGKFSVKSRRWTLVWAARQVDLGDHSREDFFPIYVPFSSHRASFFLQRTRFSFRNPRFCQQEWIYFPKNRLVEGWMRPRRWSSLCHEPENLGRGASWLPTEMWWNQENYCNQST